MERADTPREQVGQTIAFRGLSKRDAMTDEHDRRQKSIVCLNVLPRWPGSDAFEHIGERLRNSEFRWKFLAARRPTGSPAGRLRGGCRVCGQGIRAGKWRTCAKCRSTA